MVYAAKLMPGFTQSNCNVRETESSSHWFYRPSKCVSLEQSLENEIYILRKQMERVVAENQSLTSESVIQASSLLDSKINEYMVKVLRHQ